MRRNITWKIWQTSGYGFGGYPLDCERAPYVSMRSAGAITSENQLENRSYWRPHEDTKIRRRYVISIVVYIIDLP